MSTPRCDPNDTATVDELLEFILDRAEEDESLEFARNSPDGAVLDRCFVARRMVMYTRKSKAWGRPSWRTALVHLAEIHEDHPVYRWQWPRLVGYGAPAVH